MVCSSSFYKFCSLFKESLIITFSSMSLLMSFSFCMLLLRDYRFKNSLACWTASQLLNESKVLSILFFANNSIGFINVSILPIGPPDCYNFANKYVKCMKIIHDSWQSKNKNHPISLFRRVVGGIIFNNLS